MLLDSKLYLGLRTKKRKKKSETSDEVQSIKFVVTGTKRKAANVNLEY